ncbi:MAG TPA: SMP-30/gluconolactonase/LRE family protein [Lacipirellulaceae bacterium]|nr:SMP-30/gluconolactonase/LRE family protein [Lacipirellulaceae bacterium]
MFERFVRSRTAIITIAALSVPGSVFHIGRAMAADSAASTVGHVESLDPALDKLVPPSANMEVIADGFAWCEGPVWVPRISPPHQRNAAGDGFLLFSDIPNNSIMRWDAQSGCRLFLKPSGYTGAQPRGGESGSNGLVLDRNGRLILCQHGDRRVARLDSSHDNPQPKFVTLADRYDGKRLNSPNDAVVDSHGAIYFTDPPYGLEKGVDDPKKELAFYGVYRIAPNGKLQLLTSDLERPNGIALSPDEKTLYISNSDDRRPVIMAYQLKKDGTLGEGRVFFNARNLAGKPGACDGMTVDAHGNLFATIPGGVGIFTPDGKQLGLLATGDRTANCEFGEDGSMLFIAANHRILRIRTTTKGIGF